MKTISKQISFQSQNFERPTLETDYWLLTSIYIFGSQKYFKWHLMAE